MILRIQRLLIAIVLFFITTVFVFVPKTVAADPCDAITNAPLLYQINRTPNQATLFFSPLNNDHIQSYTIIYGLKAEDERYSLTVNQGMSTGALSYKINGLQSGVQYFYKVRGNTSCTSSQWSKWEGDKPVTKGSSTSVPGIPVTGPSTMIFGIVLSSLVFVTGLGIFFFSNRKPKYFY